MDEAGDHEKTLAERVAETASPNVRLVDGDLESAVVMLFGEARDEEEPELEQ